ncbi:phage/plasmid primase, P4 family [Pontibaca salina]|uniref:SF3 helicase domain-containing protein n=1 Tax=Pontibaca salina TaxID=2795731 RepID=A0A934HHN5_9RHOB|nr:DNA primase family protein [Pontibaca salina]MBI6628339.1 hypothetical protein [Pontibaca salina]
MTDESNPKKRDPLSSVTPLFPDGSRDAVPADPVPPADPGPDAPQPPQPDDVDPDRLRHAAQQPLNDYGNGQRFITHFGEDVMFVPRVGWFSWTGQRWLKDPDELAIRSRAQKVWSLIEREVDFIEPTKREAKLLEEERSLKARQVELEGMAAAQRQDDHDSELSQIVTRLKAIDGVLKSHKSAVGRRLTHAKNAGNNGPITHMMHESRTDLAEDFESLDANELDVNTRTGLLRFSVDADKDGKGKIASLEVIPHERDQLLSKMIPVEYDPDATAPLFEAFLERVQPDIEMRHFLQRWHGASMSGLKIAKLAFYFGDGANGKSVLVDLIARIQSDYAASLRIESLTGNNRRAGAEATPDLIPLLGARFVRASEPDQGERLQEGLIKLMTGGEPIPVRPNYGEQIDLDPQFKLTISGNHKPEIRGADGGIWRRVMLVPWDVQIPEDERDEQLGAKLWEERTGILNWLVEGLMSYLEMGLAPPDSVLEATEDYREESDPIGTFLTTCCTITGEHGDTVLSKDLGDAFNYHLLERGLSTWKPTTFAKQVSAKSRQWRHPQTGLQFQRTKSSLSQYSGIRLTDEFDKRFRNAPRDSQGRPIGVHRPDDPDTPDPVW